jgi:HK97 family phage major capsid protein
LWQFYQRGYKMSLRIEALQKEMTELGEQMRQVRSKDKPDQEDVKKLTDLVSKMTEKRDALEIETRADKLEKELSVTKESKQEVRESKPEKPQEKRSFGQYLQAIASVASPDGERSGSLMKKDEARSILYETRASGMAISPPSDGGFLVDKQMAGLLATRAYDEGSIARLVQKVPISGGYNGLKYPVIDETSRANGSRAGGVLAYWKNEAAALVGSKPKLREDEMSLEKLTGLCYATDELLQDADALESIIMSEFAKEFAFKLDDAVLNGTGAGQPLGILNSPALVSVAKETGQSAKTITFENIINMYSRHYAGRGTRWIINRECFPQLMTMGIKVGTAGYPIYIPGNNAANAPNGTLLGIPVIFAEQAQALGTVGDIYLVDLDRYRMIEKGGIQSASSIHVQFLYDEMVYRFIYRCNGMPLDRSATTPFKGSNTISALVALATRA